MTDSIPPSRREWLPTVLHSAIRRARRAAVLLVEDDAANHVVTAMMLRREGHRVDVAENGFDALRMVAGYPYDLVFMDLRMAGMSGFETARRIRALPGLAATVPIVALTASTTSADRAKCIAAGMDDMIGKPVRHAELTGMIGRESWSEDREPLRGVAEPAAEDDTGTAPDLDADRLRELRRGLHEAMVVSLLNRSVRDIAQRLPLLAAAVAAGNARDTEMEAHAIAGIAGTFGLSAIERLMRHVMAATRRGGVARASEVLEQMDAVLAAAAAAVAAAVESVAA